MARIKCLYLLGKILQLKYFLLYKVYSNNLKTLTKCLLTGNKQTSYQYLKKVTELNLPTISVYAIMDQLGTKTLYMKISTDSELEDRVKHNNSYRLTTLWFAWTKVYKLIWLYKTSPRLTIRCHTDGWRKCFSTSAFGMILFRGWTPFSTADSNNLWIFAPLQCNIGCAPWDCTGPDIVTRFYKWHC